MPDPIEDYSLNNREIFEACWACGEEHSEPNCPALPCPQCGTLGWNQWDGSCTSCNEVVECGDCETVYPLVEGTWIPGIPPRTGGPPENWDPGSPDEFTCPACGGGDVIDVLVA